MSTVFLLFCCQTVDQLSYCLNVAWGSLSLGYNSLEPLKLLLSLSHSCGRIHNKQLSNCVLSLRDSRIVAFFKTFYLLVFENNRPCTKDSKTVCLCVASTYVSELMSTVTFSRGFRMWQPPFRVTHSTRVNAATHRLTRASDARGSSICTKQASVKNVEFHHVRTSIQATAGRICCHTSRSFAEATLLLSAYSLMFFTFCIMFCIHIPDDGVEERCKISNVVPPPPLVYSLNHVSCAITNTSSNFYAPQNSTLVLDCLLCAALSQQRNQENEYNGESQTCSWWWCSMPSSHSRNRTNP